MEYGKKFYEMDDISQKLKQNAEQKLYAAISQESFESLLEIGCGNGHFIKNFLDKDVLGVDISQTLLDEATGLEGKLANVNIITDDSFIQSHKNHYDIITSNYVFTEMKQQELLQTFKNVYKLMQDNGSFCFTITDPRTRDRKIFPGYKLVFDQQYSYNMQDVQFKVLLENADNKYVDVGIRDFHQPIEVYDSLLEQAGFTKIARTDISEGHDCSYAVIYRVKK